MTVKDIGRRFIVSWPVEAKVLSYKQTHLLCIKPYQDHPRGCPNYGRKQGCPGVLKEYFPEVYDSEVEVCALEFDFGDYLEMMAEKHPDWTDRQLRCPLYWQGHLRKEFIVAQRNIPWGYTHFLTTPEAYGIDVTATCKEVEIELEWPPMKHSYMVGLYVKRNDLCKRSSWGA